MAYILIDEENRMVAVSDGHIDEKKEIEVTLPEDFDEKPFKTYFYQNGELVYDNTAYILVDDTSRIIDISEFHLDEENEIEIKLPEDFDVNGYMNYIYRNGEFIYSEKPTDPYEQIAELKSNLSRTDYIVTKIAEAQVTGRALPEEDAIRYADILIQREQWRAQINELEAQLKEV